MTLNVKITQLENAGGLNIPSYASDMAAGMDLHAAVDGSTTLKPMERALIPTGIAIALPKGYEAQVRPRSGLAVKNGISVLNTPGTIDADYRGEIKVILINFGNNDFVIERGSRIAQMVVAKHEQVEWSLVTDLDETQRGAGGFGSTGHK